MRLIDADALIEKAYSETEGMDKSYKDLGIVLEWLVDKMPTIKPERKKGKWIDLGVYECSVCHERSCCAGNYCPDCGTDMRGEQ